MAKAIANLADAELLAVANQVVAVMTASPLVYGTTAPQVAVFGARVETFAADVAAQAAAAAKAKTATLTKEDSRTLVEDTLRHFRDVAKPLASAAEMAELGLPTASSPAPSAATVPAAKVDTSERFRHTIAWADAGANGNKKKPRGAMGAEIWVKIGGPAPAGEAECTFLTLDAFTPYVAEHDAADASKMAHYMIRWRMRDGSVRASALR